MRAGQRRTMRFLNNLKLLTKLAIPVTIFVAITVGLIAFAKVGVDRMSADTRELVEDDAARLARLLQIHAEVNEATIQEKNLVLLTLSQLDRIERTVGVYQQYRKLVMEDLDELVSHSTTPEIRAANENIKATIAKYLELMDKSVAFSAKDNDAAALEIANGEGRDLRLKVRDILQERIATDKKVLDKAAHDAEALAASTSLWLIVSGALGVLVAVGLVGAIVIYGIVRPLSGMTGAMSRLADGDLSVSVTGAERRDEVGQLARALQVFKENALETRRLAAEQEAENEAKMRRAQVLDQ
ncbi:MAG TPA: HAMP domain-containing protein, partial [Microvirga sp.]|nr:HAMP domain-containing protein [Microvirga sp.]